MSAAEISTLDELDRKHESDVDRVLDAVRQIPEGEGVADIVERLAGELAVSESTVREGVTRALYRGDVQLSADRTLIHTNDR